MRKHKSLDGPQFMREFDQISRHPATHYPEYYNYDGYDTGFEPQGSSFYNNQPGYSMMRPGYGLNDPLSINVPNSDFYQNPIDYSQAQRENAALNQKLNYVMNSIRTFWSPELKKERELRKEENLRLSSLQNKLCQQAVSFFNFY